MVILVFGVPGVGKTTIIKKSNIKCNVVNYGDLMVRYINIDRDKLINLNLEEYFKIREKVNEELISLAKREDFILDTHAAIFLKKYGILPGFSFDVLKKLNPKIIILITSEPYEIYLRRVQDYNKRKRILDLDRIREELEMELRYSQFYSAMLGIPLKIINNRQGYLHYSIEEFTQVMKAVCSEQ